MAIGYRRSAIVYWLHNYRDTFDRDKRERNLYWAEVKADIAWSARFCSEDARVVFRLYCLDGMNFGDICFVMRWNNRRIKDALDELVDVTVKRLLDERIRARKRVKYVIRPVPQLHDFDGDTPPVCTCSKGGLDKG